ncbi:hypothetical protein F511_06541 [Dorcoceras hygrometricum]|uniref:Uncharacterized protein n=1 Tax=Dorcoceras hygrometricum TaxID=472368 RepID=A0A2Z7CJQ9_9LAMI|nr:hypothetical protein F511_06541 [Dorcoceras hygrometricum]
MRQERSKRPKLVHPLSAISATTTGYVVAIQPVTGVDGILKRWWLRILIWRMLSQKLLGIQVLRHTLKLPLQERLLLLEILIWRTILFVGVVAQPRRLLRFERSTGSPRAHGSYSDDENRAQGSWLCWGIKI